jgi:hypothetical protein
VTITIDGVLYVRVRACVGLGAGVAGVAVVVVAV